MKKTIQYYLIAFVLLLSSLGTEKLNAQNNKEIISKPPMGYNSYDSYGVYLHEDAAIRNIDELARRYKQYGYEYFVIDAGWFGEFKLRSGTMYPMEKHAADVRINEYGLLQPSKTYFPNGLKVLADRCHAKGLKFGVHIMRGIPRKAVQLNTKVQGTNYTARQIADTTSICSWNSQNYGVDMTKPGAQEFYNSLINQLAAWGVDFIKADDIVPFPKEVEAVVKAVAQCGRPIVLSLSPGGKVDPNAIGTFKKANMLRVTHDIWDDQIGIDRCFDAWRKWQGKESASFYIDMDMIPFGELQMMSPKPENLKGTETKNEINKMKKQGLLSNIELLCGKGWHRQSEFSKEQQLTFITMRALAASPLMIGGDLVSMDELSYKLLINKEMIACNQNGVMGSLIYDKDKIECWKTPKAGTQQGWIGIFNRDVNISRKIKIESEMLGLKNTDNYKLFNIWENTTFKTGSQVEIPANGVLFLKYY
jgi:hypothetical protein